MKLQEKDINAFAEHVKKLDLLPGISAQLTSMESNMTWMRDSLKNKKGSSNE